jgi:hypothetical protein
MHQGVALDPTAALPPAEASAQAVGGARRMPPERGRPRPQQCRKPSRARQYEPIW